jgi:acyl dehydratase
MSQISWYFEDFEVGKTIDVGSYTMEEAEILDFARKFDPQPFHVDKAAAAASIYGGIIASGWHTCGVIMRLIVDGFLHKAASMGSPGLEQVRWIKPVRPGDTLSVTTTALEVRPSNSKPDRGIVVNEWRATNQNGELVCTVTGMGMFLRRPA